MTAPSPVPLLDELDAARAAATPGGHGCEHCGDRSILPEDVVHREKCAHVATARKAASQVSDLPPVAVDDLFAHLVTPRAGGPVCTPTAAVEVIRYVTALGWRPAIGQWSR